MSIYNFFQDLFGIGGKRQHPNYGFEDQRQHRDEFRNPIWQTDEDDDDDNDDFRQPGGRGNPGAGYFNIYSDPSEITRYFENQMDSMLKNIFGFNQDNITLPFGDQSDENFHRSTPIEPPKKGSLRDDVLKPGYDNLDSQNHLSSDKQKLDVDLDGKITSDMLSKVWKDPSALQSTDSYTNTPQRSPFFFPSFGPSISRTIIRKADGTVEVWTDLSALQSTDSYTNTPQRSPFFFPSFGQSISISTNIIRKADGTVEVWKDPSALQSTDSYTNTPQRSPFFSPSFGQSTSTNIIRKADGTFEVWKDPSALQSTDSYTNTPQRSPFFFPSFGQSTSTNIIRKADGTFEVWKDPSALQSTDSYTNTPQRSPFFSPSFGQSISISRNIIRKADGTVEEHRIVRDSQGNEETTIIHQIGDKTRTVVIKKDKNGEKTETETINSRDRIESSSERPFLSLTDEPGDRQNPGNHFPWHKFFGPNPKL